MKYAFNVFAGAQLVDLEIMAAAGVDPLGQRTQLDDITASAGRLYKVIAKRFAGIVCDADLINFSSASPLSALDFFFVGRNPPCELRRMIGFRFRFVLNL